MKTALAGLLCASALLGADLTGIWVGQIPGRNGEPQDVAFKFTQNGATLGDWFIHDGTFAGGATIGTLPSGWLVI